MKPAQGIYKNLKWTVNRIIFQLSFNDFFNSELFTCSRSYVNMTMVNCSFGVFPPKLSQNSFPAPPAPPLIARNPMAEPSNNQNTFNDEKKAKSARKYLVLNKITDKFCV